MQCNCGCFIPYSNFTKLQAYGHPFSLFEHYFFYVVILYKLTANACASLKRFPPIIYTNRCRQNHFCLKFNTHDIDLRNQKIDYKEEQSNILLC